MRLPIVQYPSVVINNLPYFMPVFQTEEQVKHFCEYVTGMMVNDRKAIAAINALFFNNNDQSALNEFLTQADWGECDWYLSFAAYSLLGDQGPPGRSRWAVRGRFESTGQRCRAVTDELLGFLVHWIAQQNRGGLLPRLSAPYAAGLTRRHDRALRSRAGQPEKNG